MDASGTNVSTEGAHYELIDGGSVAQLIITPTTIIGTDKNKTIQVFEVTWYYYPKKRSAIKKCVDGPNKRQRWAAPIPERALLPPGYSPFDYD